MELSRAEGIVLERTREGALWEVEEAEEEHGREEAHRDEEDHGKEEAHRDEEGHGKEEAHRDEEEHGKEEARREEEEHHEKEDDAHEHHEDGHEHAHGEYNMHLWLHPANAVVIVKSMAAGLAKVDPSRAAVYRANGDRVIARLRELDTEIRGILAPVRRAGFIVFHDAWHYFDKHYGLRAVGSITVNPERAPGAARLVTIRERLSTAGVACIFAEPQFEPRVVTALVADTGVRTGEVDPIGAALEDGEDLYFELMRGNARAFRRCLEG